MRSPVVPSITDFVKGGGGGNELKMSVLGAVRHGMGV
jgi:hypothetical protein